MNDVLDILLARIHKIKAEQEAGVYGEPKGSREKWKLDGWYAGLDYVVSEIECLKRDNSQA